MDEQASEENAEQGLKAHLRRHKTGYLIAGSVVATAAVSVGVTLLVVRHGSQALDSTVKAGNYAGVAINSPMTTTVNNTIVAQMVEKSTPSNIVQSLDGKRLWSSQNEAAKSLGVDPSILSKHLHGKLSDINGERFSVIPKVAAA